MRHDPVEHADRWEIPPAGLTVDQVRIDHAVTLLLQDGLVRSLELRLEAAFVLTEPGGEWLLDTEPDPRDTAPVLRALHREVERLHVQADGRLELDVAGGLGVRAPAGDEHEAWTLTGSDGSRFVAMPGGHLAVWPPRPPAS